MTSIQVVQDRSGPNANPRVKLLVDTLVKHLHAFIKEAKPTMDEWMYGIDFLTRTGHLSTDWRQEFILLSDTLGISMLVESLNNTKASGETEVDRARPLLHCQRPALRERGQYLPRRERRARLGAWPRHKCRGRADCRRDVGRLAGERGRVLRRAAEGRAARHESARRVHLRRRGPLLLPLGLSALLSDTIRRHGRRHAEGPRPQSEPARASAFHRVSAGL